jgi:hypothetical protein
MVASDRKALAGLRISEKPLNCEVDWAGSLWRLTGLRVDLINWTMDLTGYPMDWTSSLRGSTGLRVDFFPFLTQDW